MNNSLIIVAAIIALSLIISIWSALGVIELTKTAYYLIENIRMLERRIENISTISRRTTTDSREDTTEETTNISP